jgi:prevent-host-death family protein
MVPQNATMNVVTIGVRELKAGLSTYIARVRGGEEIVVTDRGRPVARLTSVAPDLDHLARLAADGIITRARSRRTLPRPIRLTGEGSVEDLVAEQRR